MSDYPLFKVLHSSLIEQQLELSFEYVLFEISLLTPELYPCREPPGMATGTLHRTTTLYELACIPDSARQSLM